MGERRTGRPQDTSAIRGGSTEKHNRRQPRRLIFGALSGGEKLKPFKPEKAFLSCALDEVNTSQASSRSIERSLSVFKVNAAPRKGVRPGGRSRREIHGAGARTGIGECRSPTRKSPVI